MFANRFMTGCVLMVLACQTTAALAQSSGGDWPERFYQPISPLPADFGFTQHHDSTAAGNYLRGRAALIHASGGFLLSRSQSAILQEYARRMAICSDRQWIEYRTWRKKLVKDDRRRRLDAKRQKN